MYKILLIIPALIFLSAFAVYLALPHVNSYQLSGEIEINVLNEPVTVHRDKHGIPYIFATNLADAIRSQGFLVAQDRVFQVEMYRAIIDGRLASLIGEAGLKSDVQMRVIGITRNASRHLEYLNEDNRRYLRWYAEGYNDFIHNRTHEYPLELGLLGIKPQKISIAELLAIQHFAGFIQGRNYEDEILSLNLANELGADKAKELLPLNINPDRTSRDQNFQNRVANLAEFVTSSGEQYLLGSGAPVALPTSGSNNWLTGNSKSKNGMPILVNDPHLDASILPGPWYPVGIFTPDFQAIGANLPGVPGLLLGRTQHISWGLTNAYGDSQDLYIETLDPANQANYLNGKISKPFKINKQKIAVKDGAADNGVRYEDLVIRTTKRGPVISDHSVFGISSEQPIVFRSAAAEITGESLGFVDALFAKTVQEADIAFSKVDVLYMNYLFADKFGGIGHRPTGAIPLRQNGATAKYATGVDDWNGYIPKSQMPGQLNPSKDWLGTSNHDVIPDNYPYYYSTHFSPSYRYERTMELLNDRPKLSAEDHWQMLSDVKNKHAQRLTPVFLNAIANDESLSELHRELKEWNFEDQVDSVGATIFHLTHEYLIRYMLEDEMSEGLFKKFLSSRYYWLQRTDELIVSGKSKWFDIRGTEDQETLEDIIIMAASKSKETLKRNLGNNIGEWNWGKYHKVSMVSPLRREGIGADFLGGGTHEVSGSGETLNRGQYSLNEGPYKSQWFSSLRMVADMSDDKKIMGSISGGNASRQFHPYFKSQLAGWLEEEWVPWWLDTGSVQENSVHTIILRPQAP
jgi:penicillin amidase